MTVSVWVIVGVALSAVLVGALVARRRRGRFGAPAVERASRPDALRSAELVDVERLFRMSKPVSLVARIDRAYRLPSGAIVLVELKTRWIDRPLWSDVIQLSVQRLAVEGQTAQAVARYGYVVVKRPRRAAKYTPHRVELMPNQDVVALVRRREDVLAGRVKPQHAAHPETCRACGFRSECEGARLGAVVRRDRGALR